MIGRRTWAVVVLCAGAACQKAEPAAEPPKRQVRCASVQKMTVSDAITLTGTIAALPDRDAQIAAQVPGRIVKVLVREGDVVKAGQLVARVDDGPLGDDARGARASLARTEAEVKNAEATAARVERVFERGIAARQEVDDAVARAETARATRAEAEATARRAERQLGRAAVTSPLSGTVVKVFRRPGELVDGTPATPIVEVADPARLELVSDTPASELVRARPGQAAAITAGALPGASWTGTVAAVSPAVDRATGLGIVRVRLNLPDPARPPIGLLGTARVELGPRHETTGVPVAAVRAGQGAAIEVVLCGKDGAAHVRTLTRGAADAALVEAKGLTADDAVVVDPVLGVTDGEPIEIQR